MRKEFEMTDEQHEKLLDACKPTRAMWLSGGRPMGPTQQENANAAWSALGDDMGFKHMTVRPVSGKSTKHFTAEAD